MHENKLLEKIDLLSCVSGGSIVGAFLALLWADKTAALDELNHYLTRRFVAVCSVLKGLLDPTEIRLDKLRDSTM